jgi:hypothetical protein
MLTSNKKIMKTKRILTIILISLIICGGYSCNTDNLMNLDNPKYMLTTDNADMSMMFSNLQRLHGRNSAGASAIRVEATYVKYYASYTMLLFMGALYQFERSINDTPWETYQTTLKLAVTLEDYLTKLDDPNQVNNIAFTRIMKVAVVQRLTDYYGDIPVFEAGLAYIGDVLKPKYDKQQDIYKYMLETLDKEAQALTTDATVMQSTWKGDNDPKKARDIIYGGNIAKWKKYAYSLMLRMAMRISAVDPGTAKTYAEKAIAGGVITDNADNWQLATRDGLNDEKNPYSSWFEGIPGGDPEKYVKLGEYFVDFLKTNNDPRMKVFFGGRLDPSITAVIATDMQKYWRDETKWDWDYAQAKGVPHGLSANPCQSLPEYMSTYTSPNPFLFTLDQPLVILTASEMLYLISEASLNGWNTGTTAENAYAEAIRLNINQLNSYDGLLDFQKITAEEIDAYIASKPLGTGAVAKQRLAEEVWVSMYLNPSEAWFNVRRMDLKLPDNSLNAHMPVRNAYAENERSNNIENLNIALQQIGLDVNVSRETEIATRVWWDVNDNY